MRILHTISVRWWNACAYYAITLAKSQLEKGDDVFLAGVPGYLSTERAEKENIPTIPINFASKNPVQWIRERYKLKSFLASQRIDIINCHMAEDHLMCGVIAKRRNIPLVRTVGDVRIPRKNIFNSRIFRKFTSFFIFSSSANFLRYTSLWTEIGENHKIIHGGLDLNEFRPREKNSALFKRLSIPENALIIGNIGRFSKTKDHHTFLRAALLSRDYMKNRDIHFVISGSDAGLKRDDIVRFTRNLNLEKNVTILGPYTPVADLIALLDIGVISSKASEAICRIAMEYMAMGIPMVVTDINVLPEIVIDQRNGLVVPAEDPYELSQAVIQLSSDDELRTNVGQNNIEDARSRLSFDMWYRETSSVYERVLDQPNKKNASGKRHIDVFFKKKSGDDLLSRSD